MTPGEIKARLAEVEKDRDQLKREQAEYLKGLCSCYGHGWVAVGADDSAVCPECDGCGNAEVAKLKRVLRRIGTRHLRNTGAIQDPEFNKIVESARKIIVWGDEGETVAQSAFGLGKKESQKS